MHVNVCTCLCCHSSSCLLHWCPLLRALILFPILAFSDLLWCCCCLLVLSSLPPPFSHPPSPFSRLGTELYVFATQHIASPSPSVLFHSSVSIYFLPVSVLWCIFLSHFALSIFSVILGGWGGVVLCSLWHHLCPTSISVINYISCFLLQLWFCNYYYLMMCNIFQNLYSKM